MQNLEDNNQIRENNYQIDSCIRHTPRICGGDTCIRDTRIPIWALVRYKQLGLEDRGIIERCDRQLEQADLNAAWSYYNMHKNEIDQIIEEEERDNE